MFKSTKEFETAIKEVLIMVRDEKGLNSDESTFPEDDFWEAAVECVDRRFLSGINYQRTLDGKPHFTSRGTRVTYSGLAFIESK